MGRKMGGAQYCSAQRLLLAGILDACRRVIEANGPRGQHPESPDGERRGSPSSEVTACSWPRNLNHSPTSGEDADTIKNRAEQYWEACVSRPKWAQLGPDEVSGAAITSQQL